MSCECKGYCGKYPDCKMCDNDRDFDPMIDRLIRAQSLFNEIFAEGTLTLGDIDAITQLLAERRKAREAQP